MSKSAFTLKAFGLYVLVAGAALTLVPAIILAPLGLELAGEAWIRIVGLLAITVGTYYQAAAHSEARSVIAASVPARAGFFLATLALASLHLAPLQIVLFGAVDMAGALWTYAALRAEGTPT